MASSGHMEGFFLSLSLSLSLSSERVLQLTKQWYRSWKIIYISKMFPHKQTNSRNFAVAAASWITKQDFIRKDSLFFPPKQLYSLGINKTSLLSLNWWESQLCINKDVFALASDAGSFSWGFHLLKIHLLLFKFTCSLKRMFKFLKWNSVSKISSEKK
jgi:hypothetical protein